MADLSGYVFQKLEGTHHCLRPFLLQFETRKTKLPTALSGGEGYAVPVRIREHGGASWSSPKILKVFRVATPLRHLRFSFLHALQLHTLPLTSNVFEAAPREFVCDEIEVPSDGPLRVEGYLADFVEGQTLEALFVSNWSPPLDARIRIARSLCLAIEILEGIHLFHADLAPRNLIVVHPNTPSPQLRLVDFDGFYHPQVPMVPNNASRTWGTDGYRARHFKVGDPNSIVNSDRVAMAILIMEIVTRMPQDDESLKETFVSQDEIQQGNVQLPDEIRRRWPEGFEAMVQAVCATDPQSAPSPKQWRNLLRDLAKTGLDQAPTTQGVNSNRPRLPILLRKHEQEDRRMALPLPSGTFGHLAQELAWISYNFKDDSLFISGKPPSLAVFIRIASPDAELKRFNELEQLALPRGSVIHWTEYAIHIA